MAEFVWEAKARTGEVRKGTMEAENEAAVQNRLRAQQLNPIKVSKKGKPFTIGTGVSDKDIVIFTRQFATMIDAGLPLVQCLDILSQQSDNKIFGNILKDVKQSVEGGATFSDSLGKHPRVFDELFVNLVRAGEMGGILDTIMTRLAVAIEKRIKLKRQVRSALVYPAAVMVVAAAVMFVLLTWVIPTFKEMFREFGSEDDLPGLTQLVIDLSNGFVSNLHWILLALIAIIVGVTYSYRTKPGKKFWHNLLLTMPVLGVVMRKIAVARFTRTLGTLLSSGVPILDALEVCAKSSGNVVIEEAIMYARAKISEGQNMAMPLAEKGAFPPMVVQMIAVGEQTGALDQMLNKIADFYEEEVDVAVAALTSLIEPFMMVFIGGMVGTMLIAMYLPIFDIAGKIKGE
ncbi:MAG: type II secretion system F family protein [Deltaproteobacteria bacterium]|nr:type II secretion system F family protein [Deltaproteobacteria bacterium]